MVENKIKIGSLAAIDSIKERDTIVNLLLTIGRLNIASADKVLLYPYKIKVVWNYE